MSLPAKSGETEAIVIIKAAPQVGAKYGETVCCAGIDLQGRWLRLYPVAFRTLEDGQKFARWDRIRFRWRRPSDDQRPESRRVTQDTLEIVGSLRPSERESFLAAAIVSSLDAERTKGRSLALLKAEITDFRIEHRPQSEVEADAAKFAAFRNRPDLFNTKSVVPYQPCPYRFKYRYRTADGPREGTCQDWEMEATYFKWARLHGEQTAVAELKRVFGEEYPRKGMFLAMGTHSLYPDTWLINGVIRLDEIRQLSLF